MVAHDIFLDVLMSLRGSLAYAAQEVYDAWEQNSEGYDEEYGSGGICDGIAQALSGVIAENMQNVTLDDGGFEGDDHAWVIVAHDLTGFRYGVDIAPCHYEQGSGYVWTKIEHVTFTAEHIDIWNI